MFFLKKKNRISFKQALFILAALLMIVFAVEILLHGVGFLVNLRGSTDPHRILSSYQNKDWTRDIEKDYSELGKNSKQYIPFSEWEDREFHGRRHNVDAGGIRRSWNPVEYDFDVPREIYMFGGSTLWGTGVPDEYTIPSFVSQLVNEEILQYKVVNHGQGAFVFRQEVVRLISLLLRGARPDYVIFYDGYNDVLAAYQNSDADGILQEYEIKEKFESQSLAKLLKSETVDLARRYCLTCRGVVNLVRGFNPYFFRAKQAGDLAYNEDQLRDLAAIVAQGYAETLDLVDVLSQKYGFEYMALWQPTLFTELEIVGDETKLKKLDWFPHYPQLILLHKFLFGELDVRVQNEHFYNINDALSARKTQVYIDTAHLSDEGNKMVAERVASLFLENFLLLQ